MDENSERESREREVNSHPLFLYNTTEVSYCQHIFKASSVVSVTLRVHPLPKVSNVLSFS